MLTVAAMMFTSCSDSYLQEVNTDDSKASFIEPSAQLTTALLQTYGDFSMMDTYRCYITGFTQHLAGGWNVTNFAGSVYADDNNMSPIWNELYGVGIKNIVDAIAKIAGFRVIFITRVGHNLILFLQHDSIIDSEIEIALSCVDGQHIIKRIIRCAGYRGNFICHSTGSYTVEIFIRADRFRDFCHLKCSKAPIVVFSRLTELIGESLIVNLCLVFFF